jgi:hypothetical protein
MAISIKFKGMEAIPAIIVFSSTEQIESYEDINKIDDREVVEIHFGEVTDFDKLMEAYRSDDALSEITIIEDNGNEFIYYDYIIRVSLSLTTVKSDDDILASKHWIMKLAQLTETDKRLRMIVDTINKSPATMTLEEYKEARILQSKELLQKYMEKHPLISNCKNNIFAPYNATVEKQNMFSSQFALYFFNKQAGIEDAMTWNECNKPCTVWTDEECLTFMNHMKAYTKPLVSAQQQYEVDIRALSTKAEVEAYEINYDNVKTSNGQSWWIGYTTDDIQRLNEYYGVTTEKPSGADAYLSGSMQEDIQSVVDSLDDSVEASNGSE